MAVFEMLSQLHHPKCTAGLPSLFTRYASQQHDVHLLLLLSVSGVATANRSPPSNPIFY